MRTRWEYTFFAPRSMTSADSWDSYFIEINRRIRNLGRLGWEMCVSPHFNDRTAGPVFWFKRELMLTPEEMQEIDEEERKARSGRAAVAEEV